MDVRLFLLLFAATFLSEDAALFSAGALAANGKIGIAAAMTACFAGIFVGDLLLYAAGRIFGLTFLRFALVRRILSEESIARAAEWFEEKGAKAIFLSRFTPGLRLPMYFAAGLLRANFGTFALRLAFAAAVWTPLVVGFAWYFGAKVAGENLLSLGLFVVAAVFATRFLLRLTNWKNRRLLVGRLKRWRHWEFWKPQIFYVPILCRIICLMLKHRNLTVFTAANPAIEAGGFVGESKQEIYHGLAKSAAAREHLLRFAFLSREFEAAAKIELALNFIARNDLSFPVALKPDRGERGAGVFLVQNEEELRRRIETSKVDLLVQEFAAGDEFGVFYYRLPNEARGRIFAVTEKRFPFVTGDGAATLETLILRDARAVCLAKSYFERNRETLHDIPSAGEKVSLVDIGTHSRGAIFLDGAWVKTAELENKIDAVARGYEGFYFGRFDLRTDSIADFKCGHAFKIVELNGVTSEATNIYDPKNSLFAAYKILFEQWRIAFEIGAENRRKGFRALSAIELIRLILNNFFEVKTSSAIKTPKYLNPSESPERKTKVSSGLIPEK
jgi:membrane protein DedA with SNARE-associated domain